MFFSSLFLKFFLWRKLSSVVLQSSILLLDSLLLRYHLYVLLRCNFRLPYSSFFYVFLKMSVLLLRYFLSYLNSFLFDHRFLVSFVKYSPVMLFLYALLLNMGNSLLPLFPVWKSSFLLVFFFYAFVYLFKVFLFLQILGNRFLYLLLPHYLSILHLKSLSFHSIAWERLLLFILLSVLLFLFLILLIHFLGFRFLFYMFVIRFLWKRFLSGFSLLVFFIKFSLKLLVLKCSLFLCFFFSKVLHFLLPFWSLFSCSVFSFPFKLLFLFF